MINQIDFNLIDTELAGVISRFLLGKPTVNRVLLAVNSADKKTNSGIFIPGAAKEDIPKKGVVVSIGKIEEDTLLSDIHVGDVISYGLYGGKEIYPNFQYVEGLSELIKDLKFYVLSSSEIIFVEPNITTNSNTI